MRVERIVYVLGAGFSAPLGIPVMRTFMSRARDLHEESPDKYAHFKQVFDDVRRLHEAAARIRIDPDNIEDVFSAFTMQDALEGTSSAERYRQFVTDVVRASTPAVGKPSSSLDGATPHSAFFDDRWKPYAAFSLGLAGVRSSAVRNEPVNAIGHQVAGERHSVVTLNYDMVIETPLQNLSNALSGARGALEELTIAKLHGSVHDNSVVPPTWDKTLSAGPRLASWKVAFEELRQAHQVRVIGYSFPATDAYVRYLLAVSLQQATNLKRFDVISLDADGGVERRFEEAIAFRDRRFVKASVQDYLHAMLNGIVSTEGNYAESTRTYDGMSKVHEAFFDARWRPK